MSEPLNAAFFTLKHRDRAVLLPATVVLIAILAAFVSLFFLLNWGFFSQISGLIVSGDGPQTDQQTGQLVAGMFGLMGLSVLFMFPIYLAFAAYEAACLRWMIRGEAPGLFGLTLDHDTWRVYGVYWCWFLGYMVIGTIVSMLAIPFTMMSMGNIMTDPTPDPYEMMRWQFSVQLPIMIAQYVPMIFLGVRFGPAAATSVARQRFSFFEAWTVTRGRFWPLLGAFALLWLIFGVIYLVTNGAGFAFVMGDVFRAVFADWPNVDQERGEEVLRRIFNTQTIAIMVGLYLLNGVVGLGYALMSYGVNARASMVALEEGKIEAAPPA